MVTTFYPPYHFGGDATYVRSLSRALVAHGHEVEVVHCEDAYHTVSHTRAATEVSDDGITVHRLKSRFGMLSPLFTQQTGHPGFKTSELKKILARDFDVVNFHNISLVGGPAILKLSNAPVTLYTLHEHWLLCPTHIFWKNKTRACDRPQCFSCALRSGIPPQLWRYTGLVKRSLSHVDALLAPSQFTAQQHRDAGFGAVTNNNIHVLPLFSTLDPGEPPEFVAATRPRFVFVGRVTASKGVEPMLKTFAGLDDVELQVIGDGDLLAQLQQQYAECSNIHFMGAVRQSELIRLYQGATALILPSLAPETFGLTVVEAFACGTPAIVRSAGGNRELIDSTGAGFVYSSDTELEQAVSKLAGDVAMRDALGKKARASYTSSYTPEHHLQNYLAHIATIAQHKAVVLH
jgi:glycosyltransferase involved in cell wall biosynthesis